MKHLLCVLFAFVYACAGAETVASPDGTLVFTLETGARLSWSLARNSQPVVERSALGIVLDGVDLGRGAALKKSARAKRDQRYRYRGVHSEALDRAHCATFYFDRGGTRFEIEVRVFDSGAGFRYTVPASGGKPRVPDEATSFTLPAAGVAWFHDFSGHYEGIHKKRSLAEVREGEWAAPPLTVELPDGRGYAAITEAGLRHYAGMALQADGRNGFAARLGHAVPAGHPYLLRYGESEAKRLSSPAAIAGVITTPWRVVLSAPGLNGLVNSDVISNLVPPPDTSLFPKGIDTPWVRPGRAVWKYLDGGESTFDGMKDFSRTAGELGFEYNVIEGFWQKWTDAELKELVDYSAARNVRLILWKHSRDLRQRESRRELFRKLHGLGVAGLKIDFFDHEAKEVVELYEDCLRDAAEFQLVLNFHGANKPTGLERPYPNELTREGVRGMEYRSMETRAQHDATLPFTRYLAGPGDYTPMHFGDRRKETSWAHQIATAAVFNSPLLVYAANPKSILENPAADVIKSIPSVWDETVVLPDSRIGEVAAFARRSGNRWFLAVVNGPAARKLRVDLSFLGPGAFQAALVRDDMENPAAVKLEKAKAGARDTLEIDMRPGGGFIARFTR